MNQRGISNKAIVITVIVVLLILIGAYFITQAGNGVVEEGGDVDIGELDSGLEDALGEEGAIGADLGLDEDFDFDIE